MPRKLYTDEMKKYMSEIVPGRRLNEVTELMNRQFNTDFTESQLENLKSRLRLKNGLPTNFKGRDKIMSDEQEKFIHNNYKGLFNKELTDLVNQEFKTSFTVQQISSYKSRNKLDSGIGGYFKKGHEPFNKGLKQEEFMSAESIEKTKRTRFKKGQKPTNWEPVGYERTTREGYIEVKVRDDKGDHSVNNFELKHRIVWAEHYGEIPKQCVVLFKNGDPKDVRIENLMMVHRGISLHLNKRNLRSEYPELTEAGVNLVKLQFQTNKALEG